MTRYSYDLDSARLTHDKKSNIPLISISRDLSTLPLFSSLIEDKNIQLGFNIPHIKSDTVYFNELKGDDESITNEELYGFLRCFNSTLCHDPDFTSLTITKPHTFSLHTSNKSLIELLNGDVERRRYTSARATVESFTRCPDYTPNPEVIRLIGNDPSSYSLVLSFVPEELREDFHKKTISIFEEREKIKEKWKSAEHLLNMLEGCLDELDKIDVYSQSIRKAVSNLRRRKDKNKFIPISRLESESRNIPSRYVESAFSIPFRIERMSTTLHNRVNESYSPKVLSYRLTEPRDVFLERLKSFGFN